jgi:hypothetical protein
MKSLIITFIVISLTLIFVASGCGNANQNNTGGITPSWPEPTIPNQKTSNLKDPRINGDIVVGKTYSAEIEDALSVTAKVVSGNGKRLQPDDLILGLGVTTDPQVIVTCRNLSNKDLNLWGDEYSSYNLTIVSLDDLGKPLDSLKTLPPSPFGILTLSSGKEHAFGVQLHKESRGFQIKGGFNPIPSTLGQYSEAPEIAGMAMVSHKWRLSGGLFVECAIKDNSTPWKSSSDKWTLRITFLDAAGNAIGIKDRAGILVNYLENLAISPNALKPEMVHSFKAPPPSSGLIDYKLFLYSANRK